MRFDKNILFNFIADLFASQMAERGAAVLLSIF